MAQYRPIDSKREEFRKYLERAGVMDALTKVLVSLYEEPDKPTDALDYVRKHLGDNRPDLAEFEALQAQCEELRNQKQELEEEMVGLKERLAQLENPEPEEVVDADGDPEEPPEEQ